MGNTRREFTPEHKDEAVKLVINTGQPVATVARELGVKEQSVGRCVGGSTSTRPAKRLATVRSATERVELARLRKEVFELKMDRRS